MILGIPIEYKKFFNKSIRLIDWTQTCTTTPCQSGPGINGNEAILIRVPELESPHQIQFGLVWFGFMAYQPLLVIG